MGAFKWVVCMMTVGIFAFIPLMPPVKQAIIDAIGTKILYDSYYMTISWNVEIVPGLMAFSIGIVGTFLVYCVYRGYECSWRKERVKQDLFVPNIFDEKP